MKTLDLLGSAIGNTLRSKTRTILTMLAIFVGAFTLTITNGLGTGITGTSTTSRRFRRQGRHDDHEGGRERDGCR